MGVGLDAALKMRKLLILLDEKCQRNERNGQVRHTWNRESRGWDSAL